VVSLQETGTSDFCCSGGVEIMGELYQMVKPILLKIYWPHLKHDTMHCHAMPLTGREELAAEAQ